MITETQIIVRLLLAAALGAVVGLERERQNQPAGLRTHIVLAVGASLAMMLSISIAVIYHPVTGSADPARLAAQVVSGIGFLGAGAILRYGSTIKGLTTAASLWTVAVVGMTVGVGLIVAATGTTLLLLVILTIVNWIEKRYIHAYTTWTVKFQSIDRPGLYDDFHRIINQMDQKVKSIGVSKVVGDNLIIIEAIIQTVENQNIHPLLETLSGVSGAKQVEIREGGTT